MNSIIFILVILSLILLVMYHPQRAGKEGYSNRNDLIGIDNYGYYDYDDLVNDQIGHKIYSDGFYGPHHTWTYLKDLSSCHF